MRPEEHARQKVSGLTGFDISVRNKVEVRQEIVGYLPTINMTTGHEVLVRSVKINDALQLKSIVVVLMPRQMRLYGNTLTCLKALPNGNVSHNLHAVIYTWKALSRCWPKGHLYRVRSDRRRICFWCS